MSRRMRNAVLLMAVAVALVLGFLYYQYRSANTREALVGKSVQLAAEGSYADATRAIDKAMSAPQDGKYSDNALLLKKPQYLQKSGDTEQAMSHCDAGDQGHGGRTAGV